MEVCCHSHKKSSTTQEIGLAHRQGEHVVCEMSAYIPHIALREARAAIAAHEGGHHAQDPDAAVVAIRLARSTLEASTNQEPAGKYGERIDLQDGTEDSPPRRPPRR
jgi:hypothetical protein